jgi:hypothetical protein
MTGLLLCACAGALSHSWAASATANVGATIIAPVNVSTSAVAAYTQVLFSSSTGTLSIRIPIAQATMGLAHSACGWAMNGGGNSQCNAPMTLQMVNDGTLTGQQGVSLSVTRESDASGVVIAMLAYN